MTKPGDVSRKRVDISVSQIRIDSPKVLCNLMALPTMFSQNSLNLNRRQVISWSRLRRLAVWPIANCQVEMNDLCGHSPIINFWQFIEQLPLSVLNLSTALWNSSFQSHGSRFQTEISQILLRLKGPSQDCHKSSRQAVRMLVKTTNQTFQLLKGERIE